MARRTYLIPLVVVVLILCSSCAASGFTDTSASKTAEKFFTDLQQNNPDNQKAWGMSEWNIFGRADMVFFQLNGPESRKITDSPLTYEVTIPFWIEGTALNGTHVKAMRKIAIKVADPGTVQGYEFRENVNLDTGQQILTWLLWSLLAPVILVIFALILGWWQYGWGSFLLLGLAGLFGIGYASHFCFGTVWGIIGGVAAHFVFWYFVISAAANRT